MQIGNIKSKISEFVYCVTYLTYSHNVRLLYIDKVSYTNNIILELHNNISEVKKTAVKKYNTENSESLKVDSSFSELDQKRCVYTYHTINNTPFDLCCC